MKRIGRSLVAGLLVSACGELTPPGGCEDCVPQGDDVGEDFVDPPNLNDLPSEYGYETVPVRGHMPPNQIAFVSGGKVDVIANQYRFSDGSFCVDVPLNLNSDNELVVTAQNENGDKSTHQTLYITHDPSLAQTEVPEQPLTEPSAGKTVSTTEPPQSGNMAALTDGDAQTNARLRDSVIWIDLGDRYRVELIEIEFAHESEYGGNYMILGSTANSPSTPEDGALGWNTLYDVFPNAGIEGAADGGVDSFEVDPPVLARHIAFQLEEDADWDVSVEDFVVANISILGRLDEQAAPQLATPTCANGRSP